jgi:hypothetical protein
MHCNDESKKVSFEGISNRYQMKKLVDNSTTPKIKKNIEKWNFLSDSYSEKNQLIYLKEIHDDTIISRESVIIKREIEKKIQSYKQQDISKSRFSENDFITFENVIKYLMLSKLMCYYCSCFMFLLYEHVRETNQWTLDRIDNSIGHNQGNIVISCLKCNLKRRKINQGAFLFTKNLNIIKSTNISC